MSVNLSDWENSKENIIPLKSGRDASKLSEYFKEPPSQTKLEEQRQYVEQQII